MGGARNAGKGLKGKGLGGSLAKRAQKHGASGAGVLSSLVGADGLVELPEDMTSLESGNMVDFLPFNEVFA